MKAPEAIGSGSQKLIKDNNKKLIVNFLSQKGALTKKEISESIRLSLVSVSKNTDELLGADILRVKGIDGETPSGRKPIVLEFNPNFKYIVGIDLGKDVVEICVGNLSYEILCRAQYQLSEEAEGQTIIDNIVIMLFKLLATNSISIDHIGNIVIANPGVIFDDSGCILRPAKIAQKWAGLPLAYIFSQNFKANVIVKNDINVSALGFQVLCAKRCPSNYVFLRVDAGIGMGIVIDGVLLEGETNNAGEIGFTTCLKESGELEVINYESVATIPALMESVKKLLPEYPDSGLFRAVNGNAGQVTLELVSKFAEQDLFVQRQIGLLAKFIGVAALNALLLLDINTIVLDGDILSLGDPFLESFQEVVNQNRGSKREIEVIRSRKNSALFGCLHIGRHEVLEHDI